MTAPSPDSTLITVVIADDHAMFRDGLTALLRLAGDFAVLGAASDGETALALCRSLRPQLLLVDFSLPGRDGLAILREALAGGLCAKAVLLTMHKHASIAADARAAGAAGYVIKEEAFADLADVLRAVAAGEDFVEPAGLLGQPADTPALSPREKTVLAHIAAGLIGKEIAARMNLSVKTIETFRARLMKKTGARNMADLTRHALRHGIIHDTP